MLKAKRQVAQSVTVTAPIGGWNARDPLATMKPTDAVVLDNWFCTPTELKSRKGYSEWATGIPGNVQSIIDYDKANGTEKMFAVSNNSGTCAVYDVTSPGAVGAAVVTGLTNAKWDHSQFATSGGSFLLSANGVDNVLLYDGTTWEKVTGVSAHAITGIATTSLATVHPFKRRLWFTQVDSLKAWYLGIDSIAGAATSYDFGPIFELGGHIVKIDTWSLDAGTGMDDHMVVITSAGQVAIYQGTDPASSTTWALVGVYVVGSPVGTRCTCKYGGDVMLLNKDGMIPLSKALMSTRVNNHMMISDKIQNQLASDTTTYKDNFGWDVLLYPPQNMLLVNIPISTTESYQYVMNTISGGWSRWTNIPAYCWYFANEFLYFGTAGKVCKAWDTNADNGANIVTDLLPAFNSFGGQRKKRWTLVNIMMGSDNAFAINSQMNLDFDMASYTQTPPGVVSTTGSKWDTAIWDTSTWFSSDIQQYSPWLMASGISYYGSYRIKTSSKVADVRYYSTTYVFEQGGLF